MTDNGMLDKVRKLMAQAEDSGASPAEAEAFMDRAMALMAKYGLDEALVNAKRAVREVPEHRRVTIDGSYSAEKADLIGWIGSVMRCTSVHHNRGKKVMAVTLIGFPSDLERAELLYTSLLLQAASQLRHVKPDTSWDPWARPSASATAAYRRSWFHGFAVKVWSRLKDIEDRAAEQAAPQAAAQGTSMELVLVDRNAQVEKLRDELFPALGKLRQRTRSGGGFSAGSAAGEKADIGLSRVGGTRTSIGA